MIEVNAVSKFFNSKIVLTEVSFCLQEGAVVGVIGPSGSGKSVLLKILAGILKPDAGEINRGGELNRSSTSSFGSSNPSDVGFLFQEGALFDSMSVLENVAFPLLNSDILNQKKEEFNIRSPNLSFVYERAFAILKNVGLAGHIDKYPGQLSGGMQRRVAIARSLVSNPRLVLLDDPTGGLDPVTSSRILALIQRLQQEYNMAIVIVSHDIRRLLPIVTRVIALFYGRILCDLPISRFPASADSRVVKFIGEHPSCSL